MNVKQTWNKTDRQRKKKVGVQFLFPLRNFHDTNTDGQTFLVWIYRKARRYTPMHEQQRHLCKRSQ
jgi:hypothetical protein